MLRFNQVPASTWPRGDARPLAVLRLEPEELPDLRFELDADDLDEVAIAVIKAPEGWEFGLLRYARSPRAGTGVYVVVDESRMPNALAALTTALDMSTYDLAWVSPLCEPE